MVAGFWTLDRTTITGQSAVILRQHTTPFRPMIVPFDAYLSKPENVRAAPYAQISARQCAGLQIRPHSTLGRERFFKAGPRASVTPAAARAIGISGRGELDAGLLVLCPTPAVDLGLLLGALQAFGDLCSLPRRSSYMRPIALPASQTM